MSKMISLITAALDLILHTFNYSIILQLFLFHTQFHKVGVCVCKRMCVCVKFLKNALWQG